VPDWLQFLLLVIAWSPILILLHEAGHAFTALALTDGEVSLSLRGTGMLGGKVSYEPATLRRSHDEVWIAAAGPAATFAVAAVLWIVWLKSDTLAPNSVVGAGAWAATIQLMCSALPLRYGAGLGGPADSDGRVIWRILTGGPPGGVEGELRRLGKPERAARPAFVVILIAVFAFSVWMDVILALQLLGMFGLAVLLQRSERRR
jgi:hypothetical protein